MKRILAAAFAAALTTIALPAAAQNSDGAKGGALGGAAAGAVGGAIVGGPVGAVVGGIGGAAAGAVTGSMAPDDRVYVREYVGRHRIPSVTVRERIAVGEPLPRAVKVHPIEGNERLAAYNYAYVNDRYYLVDDSGRVVEVIER